MSNGIYHSAHGMLSLADRARSGGCYHRTVIYLKLIVNAFWAGLYAALLVTLLTIFLNDDPSSPGPSQALTGPLFALALVAHAPAIALTLPTLFVCLRFFAARRLGTSWLSLKAAVWFILVTLGVLTAAAYHNLRWTGALIPPASHDALRVVCGVMAGSCLLALAAASAGQFKWTAGPNRSRMAALIILLLPAVLLTGLMPAGVRSGRSMPHDRFEAPGLRPGVAPQLVPRARRLLLVGIDAASMDYVLPMVSMGDLPALARLIREGASGRLDSIRPCVSRVAWTSLVTGMPPWSSGVRGETAFALPWGPAELTILPGWMGFELLERAGVITASPVDERARRSPALWEILRQAGLPVSVVGFEGAESLEAEGRQGGVHDDAVEQRIDEMLGGEAFLPGSVALRRILHRSVAEDLAARELALAGRSGSPAVLAVRFRGLARVSRHFLGHHLGGDARDYPAEDRAALGRVLGRYYAFMDGLVAEQVQGAGDDAFVIVVSAHGVEAEPAWRRALGDMPETGPDAPPPPSGSWRYGPDGILVVKGEGVAPGKRVDEAGLLDVVPTALYALGMPVGRDMRGDLLRRVFDRDYLESHPVHFIPGHAASVRPR